MGTLRLFFFFKFVLKKIYILEDKQRKSKKKVNEKGN